ncbi:EF-hand domain-containing protein [Cupriavidus basilensis]
MNSNEWGKALLAVAAGTVVVLGSLHAGPVRAASPAEQFKAWDPDNDGTIDMEEAKKAAVAKFESLHKDHDGTLDMKELASAKIDEKTFAKADVDNDHTLDQKEYLMVVEQRFKAADTDNDGTLSPAELKTKAGKALSALLK